MRSLHRYKIDRPLLIIVLSSSHLMNPAQNCLIKNGNSDTDDTKAEEEVISEITSARYPTTLENRSEPK